MPKTEPKDKIEDKEPQKPLFNITLPAPASGNPEAPLPVSQHNACAQKNFEQVANIMIAIINNQKMISLAVTELNKAVKELKENDKKIIDDIRKLVEEEKKNESTKTS